MKIDHSKLPPEISRLMSHLLKTSRHEWELKEPLEKSTAKNIGHLIENITTERVSWGDINEAQAQTLKEYFQKTPASDYELDPISESEPAYQIEIELDELVVELDALVVELCRKGLPAKALEETFAKIEKKYKALQKILSPKKEEIGDMQM